MASLLEQLRGYTTVVSDSGDFNAIQQFRPQDATTNPSLIAAAAEKPEYLPVVDDVLKKMRKEAGAQQKNDGQDQRLAAAQASERGLDGADRSRRILLVDADLPRSFEMPAYKGIGEQLTFENDTELEGEVDVKNWNVERGCVRDRVNARSGWFGRIVRVAIADIICAGDRHRRQDCFHDEQRPETGEIVLDASVAVEERADQRDRAQNDGVKPDQRRKNEIGAEATGPAVPEGEVRRTRVRPRGDRW